MKTRPDLETRHEQAGERSHVLDALYGDRLSFVIGCAAIITAASVTAVHAGRPEIWIVTLLIGLMSLVRLVSFGLFLSNEAHRTAHPDFWKQLYLLLGTAHLAIIGSWTTVVFWTSDDHFSELLSVMGCISFLIGTQGRNFSSLSIIKCQLLACVLPMLAGFYGRSPVWAVSFSLFFAAFYFTVVMTSDRIGRLFRDAIRAADENRKLAHTDALTGLSNRIDMQQEIRASIAGRESFTLLFIDLDRFKRINDTLGHIAGDRFLSEVAVRLSAIVGGSGLVSRYAGDEFLVLHRRTPGGRASSVLAEEILRVLHEPILVNGVTMQNGCSIGIACHPEDAATFEALSHAADIALYDAKEGGRGRIAFHSPEMLDRAVNRLALETDLRQALTDRALKLYFQPIVRNGSLRIEGCEALVRWDHPTRGRINPADFLPVAEESGLISTLTDQTFAMGCRAAAEWPEEVGISINLSPSQLQRADLLDMIVAEIRGAGIDPGRLEIEITENIVLDQEPAILDKLFEIRDIGVRLSLDDFGTGYSNLGQIALLPICRIKLDKTFLKDFESDNRQTAVLRGAIRFIASLDLEIVLEGLESEAHLAFATAEPGISHLQGYAFGIPMPQEAIRDLLGGAHRPSSRRLPSPHRTIALTS